MSKQRLNLRVPNNLERELEEFEEREGIENTSEAARQAIRRGIDKSERATAGERLLETTTGVAGVATLGAYFMAPSFFGVFGIATFVFALLWAGVMVYAGRDLV